jgi:hypothetical protein
MSFVMMSSAVASNCFELDELAAGSTARLVMLFAVYTLPYTLRKRLLRCAAS